ncbi:MAG: TetR/AcrR family transcriptional regulator [Chloroflexota bacterium]|nr:TetR/AcrR family transcriptional regulator [Chloroflexota bacterium]
MSRKEILDAAAKIFGENGYHATSMQDIAKAVQLKKGSLYHHVSSKQEILFTLLEQALDLLIERIAEVAAQDLPPAEKLKLAVSAYLEILTENRPLSAVLLLEQRSLEPKFQAIHNPHRDQFENIWRGIIQEGIDAGQFNSTDPAQVTRTLLGSLNWTITWYNPAGPLTSAEIAEQSANILLNGLLICENGQN